MAPRRTLNGMTVGALSRGVLIATVVAMASCAHSADEPDRSPDPEPTHENRSLDNIAADVAGMAETYGPVTTGTIVLVRVGDQFNVITSGRSDKAHRTPMSADQTFPIASITKPMTAVVVLQLVAEGRLALDEPVQPWLPELADVRPPITVEQLLSHRSGLPDATNVDVMRLGFGTEAHLREAAADGLDFRPGTDGSYDNLGYAALGLLVERVLDRPLSAVFQDRIFDAAAMTTASLGGDPDVGGYVSNSDSTPMLGLDLFPAAGSVVASAGDIDAFFQSLWQAASSTPTPSRRCAAAAGRWGSGGTTMAWASRRPTSPAATHLATAAGSRGSPTKRGPSRVKSAPL